MQDPSSSTISTPYKSLTNCSGLAHIPRATIYFVMSLNVSIAICVLACDFLIYAFFRWTFGEKHREFRRPISKTAPVAKPQKRNAIEPAVSEYCAPRPHLIATRERFRHTERKLA
jgi:hypothetical protein